jgi:hypothetical protein
LTAEYVILIVPAVIPVTLIRENEADSDATVTVPFVLHDWLEINPPAVPPPEPTGELST